MCDFRVRCKTDNADSERWFTRNPAMALAATEILPFHRSLIEEEEISAVLEVLRGGWLTSGPRVKEFEAAFANYIGASHAIAFNSCTAGLHLALAAVGIQEGDEVIVPAMTFA